MMVTEQDSLDWRTEHDSFHTDCIYVKVLTFPTLIHSLAVISFAPPNFLLSV